MDVLSIGNATVDVFVLLHNLQKFSYDKFTNQISFPLGEKVPLDEYKLCLGGNACNVSVGLSRLGLSTSIATQIGDDEFSERIIRELEKENVDQRFLKKIHETDPRFNIILSFEGERTILEEKNPHQLELKVDDINPRFIYLTSFNGEWKSLYDKLLPVSRDSLIGFNPGSRQINENLDDVISYLPYIEILFLNLEEARKIAREDNPDIKDLLNKVKQLGPKTVSITDGANGSYAIDKEGQMFQIATSGERPAERTGAGDSYATGFIYGYLDGKSLDGCMRFGAINASSVIKKVGAQDGLLTKEEIEQKLEENKNLTAVKI